MLPYIVRQGDTLLRIAQKFGVNAESLLAANPRLTAAIALVPGLLLSVPDQQASVYCIQKGDTLLRLAAAFNVPVPGLVNANPHLDLKQLVPGQLITIPPGARSRIVEAGAEYGHAELQRDLEALENEYPFLQKAVIGYSVMHKPIPAIRLGDGPRKLQINAAMHANEWITAPLLMCFVEDAAKACACGGSYGGADMRRLMQEVSVWFVPLVNPDGAELVQVGLQREHPYFTELQQWNRQSKRFTKWKANVRGVDLNDQFPAFWEEEVKRRGTPGPGPRDYPGAAPLSEPEAQALFAFTREQDFDMVMALHTQGQEIYWNYRGYEPQNAEAIARKLGLASDYKPVKLSGSDAGFKDWFIQDFRKPGFTVEIGAGVNPLPIGSFPDLYDELWPLLLAAIEGLAEQA